MQLNWLCSSSGTMLIGDASLLSPIGFALGIAVNSSALLCKQQLRRVVGNVVTPRSETY